MINLNNIIAKLKKYEHELGRRGDYIKQSKIKDIVYELKDIDDRLNQIGVD